MPAILLEPDWWKALITFFPCYVNEEISRQQKPGKAANHRHLRHSKGMPARPASFSRSFSFS